MLAFGLEASLLICEVRLSAPNKDVIIPPVVLRSPSSTSATSDIRPALKPLSTEGSIIPGETEEDGLLRREYVLVGDTRAVEFNRAVDGTRLVIYLS